MNPLMNPPMNPPGNNSIVSPAYPIPYSMSTPSSITGQTQIATSSFPNVY
jgi:hypothetical protein